MFWRCLSPTPATQPHTLVAASEDAYVRRSERNASGEPAAFISVVRNAGDSGGRCSPPGDASAAARRDSDSSARRFRGRGSSHRGEVIIRGDAAVGFLLFDDAATAAFASSQHPARVRDVVLALAIVSRRRALFNPNLVRLRVELRAFRRRRQRVQQRDGAADEFEETASHR